MIKKFVAGKRSRHAGLVLNLLILILAVVFLGVNDFGFISLFFAGVAINQQLSCFFGGRSLPKLMEEYNQASLLFISYAGILFVHLAMIPVYLWLKPFDIQFLPEFFLISIMNALYNTNQIFILTRKKEEIHKVLEIFRVLLQLLIFVLFVFKTDVSVVHYFVAAGIGLFMAMTGSMGVLVNEIPFRTKSTVRVLIEVLKAGFRTELNQVLQILSFRINYFMVARWLGFSVLGEFSLFIIFAESLSFFGKHKATHEYVYKEDTDDFERKISISGRVLFKRLLINLAGMVAFFILFLTIGAISLKTALLMLPLFPGILVYHSGVTISHHFKHADEKGFYLRYITLGFFMTALTSFLLVHSIGLFAASLSTTVGYGGFCFAQYQVNKKKLKFIS